MAPPGSWVQFGERLLKAVWAPSHVFERKLLLACVHGLWTGLALLGLGIKSQPQGISGDKAWWPCPHPELRLLVSRDLIILKDRTFLVYALAVTMVPSLCLWQPSGAR